VRAPISVATLQAFVAQGADGLERFVEEIRGQLEGADVAHFDETGARVEGALSWIHCASTDRLTLCTRHAKRGRDGIDAAGVLPGFGGAAVHDGWAPYRLYEKARHALCGAHHLRELLGAEEQGASWAAAMSALLLDAKDAVEQAIAAGRDHLGARALAMIRECYRDVIALGYEQNPGLESDQAGRRPKRTKAQNLLLRLDQHEREVLRFACDLRCRSITPCASGTCGLSSCSRRSPVAGAHARARSGCWRSAPTSRPPASRASAPPKCSPASPAGSHGCRSPPAPETVRPGAGRYSRAVSKRSRRRPRNPSPGSPPRRPAPATSPPLPAERLLLDQIAAGELDPHLTAIADAVHARQQLLETINSAKALAMLNIGDRVRFNHHTRPQYLRGVEGVVIELDQHTATVCIHQPVGRFHSGEIRQCPPLLLDRLHPAA
jgi:Transposase IS66 family